MIEHETEDSTLSNQPDHPRVPDVPPIVRPPKTPRRATWPLVLGIIGLIFAVIQTISFLATVGASLLSGNYESIIVSAHPGLTGNWMIVGIIWLVIQLAVLMCLYVGALGLMFRRKWGITASKIYAVCLMVTSLLGIVITVLRWDSLTDNSELQNLPAQFPMEALIVISMGFSVVLAVGVGVGVFVWLRSGPARREWSAWR